MCIQRTIAITIGAAPDSAVAYRVVVSGDDGYISDLKCTF